MNNKIVYDAKIIEEFAAKLYAQASTIIFISVVSGIVIGALIGYYAGMLVRFIPLDGPGLGLGALIGGVIGFSAGQERAFKLKLEAQVALCQVQIEKNTKPKQ